MDPIVAVYEITLTVRSAEGAVVTGMPVSALTETVEQAVIEAYGEAEPDAVITANAIAKRTDR